MNEQEIRKDFERIFMLTNYDQGLGEACLVRIWKDEENSPYSFNRTEYLWTLWKFAWQASREALVIDLPQQSGANPDWNQAIRYCRQAIEDAGVKVKV